jgi:hypothetical protein
MSGKTSKKKRKSSREKVKVKVKIHVEDSLPAGNPIVVSFPGGLPEPVENAKSSGDRPKFLWQKLHEKASAARRIIGEDDHCVYSASFQGPGSDERRTKLCVGVYDKKRGVVVVREAAAKGSVFPLSQTVPAYLQKNGTVSERPGMNKKLHYHQVFEDFGSAKKRKVLKSQAANQVDIDNVVGAGEGSAMVQQIMKGKSMSESNRKAIEDSKNSADAPNAVEAAYETARRKFLPEYDENAVKPHKVYSGKAIAGEKAWLQTYNKMQGCMKENDPTGAVLKSVFETDWLPSVQKLVKLIPADAHDATERFACAVLLNSIARFYVNNNQRRSLTTPDESKDFYHGIPVEVASICVQLFTTPFLNGQGKSSHAMSKADKDKCLVHALILYIRAHGESMSIADLRPIAEDMKVLVNDCGQMLRLAGCTVMKKGKSMSAVLKTPLTFPTPKRGGSRGRGR